MINKSNFIMFKLKELLDKLIYHLPNKPTYLNIKF